MVKKITLKVPSKGVAKSKDSQRIYLTSRVKKAMGGWHPNFNPKVHRYQYLHGLVMTACGYRKWVVWRNDGYNWNRLYTGDSYHSAGLKVCNREDIQGFSDIPIRERVKYITDTIQYQLDDNTNGNEEDLPTGARLSFTKDSPHTKFVHFHTVTPTKAAKYDQNSPIPNDEDSYDTAKLDQIVPHDTETSELDIWKDEIKKLIGDKVYVPYDKTKRVEWTIEKIIENKNTHIEESGDFHPVYDYQCMDPSKVNPLKIFLEVFPEKEMEYCVELFNSQDESNLASTCGNHTGQKKLF